MKRALMAAAVPAAFVVASFVGVAPASAHDFNCVDFRSMADAQAHYDADTSDPDGLDGPPGPATDGQPGVACESQEYPQPGNPAIYGAPPVDATTTTTGMTTGTSAPMPGVGVAASTTAPMPSGPVATGFGGTAPQPADAPSPLLVGGAASLLAGLALVVAGGLRLRRTH